MQRHSFKKTTVNLSPEIHHLAEQAELGQLCTVYPVSKRRTTIWIIGQLCLIWSLILLSLPTLLLFLKGLPLPIPAWIAIVAASLLLIAGCYLSFSPDRYAHWQISLWHSGFIYEKQQLHLTFRWDQIETIQANLPHGPHGRSKILYLCKVHHQNGDEVNIEAIFSNTPELIGIILEESAYHLTPQNLRISSPRSISTFSSFKLDRDGISNAQEALSWSEVQELIIQDATVTLRKKEE